MAVYQAIKDLIDTLSADASTSAGELAQLQALGSHLDQIFGYGASPPQPPADAPADTDTDAGVAAPASDSMGSSDESAS
jgi:hypothetical protein